MTTLVDIEVRRARWRRVRAACHLVDPADPEFACGGLARRLDEVNVRCLALPDDPERSLAVVSEEQLTRLDSAVQEWGEAHNVRSPWGYGRSASGGATLYGFDNSISGPWNQYLCLRADGGLEIGLGSQAAWTQNETKTFCLTALVARLWWAFAVHAEVQMPRPDGSWEVTLALAGTQGSLLGGLAEGWPQPFQGFGHHDMAPCCEPNVLIRIERDELSSAGDAEELAFTLGGLVENAWGHGLRRFIVRTGPRAGQLDWRAVY
jgi:hypothetical protein